VQPVSIISNSNSTDFSWRLFATKSALLRHQKTSPACLLSGAKRSCRKHRLKSESDPNRTLGAILALMYQQGSGVPRTPSWPRTGIFPLRSRARSLRSISWGYDKGHGGPPSAVIAYKWLNLAAARADPRKRDYYVRILPFLDPSLDPISAR
jgi:hypothetical protein